MAKLQAIFTSIHGWAGILVFITAGITALAAHGVSVPADIITALSVVNTLTHPTV